jgi:hypothetical protein
MENETTTENIWNKRSADYTLTDTVKVAAVTVVVTTIVGAAASAGVLVVKDRYRTFKIHREIKKTEKTEEKK